MGEFTSTALIDGLTAQLGSSNRFAILCDGLGANPSLLQVIQAELPQASNYARKTFTPGAVTYDTVQLRAEMAGVAATWAVSAGDATISFDSVVILSGTSALANRGVSSLNGVSDRFVLTDGNPFADGDKVVVTAGIGGAIPTPAQDVILTVANSDGTSIQLLDADSEIVPVAGSVLPLLIRNANGSARYVENVGSQQILPGETKTFTLFLNNGKSNANVTAA